jgi:hypothetical protein
MKVFWSWQSDTPENIGRYFVRDALTLAIKELKQVPEIDEREERELVSDLHLDHDRKGVPGSPDLANLILEKISQSQVFVADVTAAGTAHPKRDQTQKKLINSNVAIELGYALATLGDKCLLMVMNEYYGGRLDLPFDLHTKAGPITFRLSPEANKEAIAAAAHELKSTLKIALKLFISQHAEDIRIQKPFVSPIPVNQSTFRPPGNALGRHVDPTPFGPQKDQEIFLQPGPAIWLRVMPPYDPAKKWASHELREAALRNQRILLEPFSCADIHSIRAEDGFGFCSLGSSAATDTRSVAFAFESGEVWSVDTWLFAVCGDDIPFLENDFAERLQQYAQFLEHLGIKPPFRWIAGITDIKGRFLQLGPPAPGRMYMTGMARPKCLAGCVVSEGVYDMVQTPHNALNIFFKSIFDKCGIPRPAHLPA